VDSLSGWLHFYLRHFLIYHAIHFISAAVPTRAKHPSYHPALPTACAWREERLAENQGDIVVSSRASSLLDLDARRQRLVLVLAAPDCSFF
jgi:hypothetical protein